MVYNLFVPVVGGEGFKAYWLKKRGDVPLKKLVWTALLDRASGLVGLVLVTGFFFYFSSYDLAYKWAFYLLIPLAYVVSYAVTYLFFNTWLPAWNYTQLLSLGVQILQALTAYLVIMALDIDEQIANYLFVFLLATFAFILPIVGAREMAFVFGAEYLGLNMELSLAIGLLFYLCLALNSLMGSYFLLNPSALGEWENSPQG
jgi:hypothetical protein